MTIMMSSIKVIAIAFYLLLLALCAGLILGVIKYATMESLLSLRPDYWAATYLFMIALVVQVALFQMRIAFNGGYVLQVLVVGFLLAFSVVSHFKPVVSILFGSLHIALAIIFFVRNLKDAEPNTRNE